MGATVYGEMGKGPSMGKGAKVCPWGKGRLRGKGQRSVYGAAAVSFNCVSTFHSLGSCVTATTVEDFFSTTTYNQ